MRLVWAYGIENRQATTVLQNVAESGVTVANMGLVISSGVQCRVSTDVRTGATVNALQNLSKAQMTQQQGRTGRADEGDHITMMSYDQYVSQVRSSDLAQLEESDKIKIDSSWPFFCKVAIPVSNTSSGAAPC